VAKLADQHGLDLDRIEGTGVGGRVTKRDVLAHLEGLCHSYVDRAADVAHLSGMLDEVVSELRVAAGQTSFDLSLVANTIPDPPMPLPSPDGRATRQCPHGS